MVKKITLGDFFEKSKNIHGDSYNYSMITEYKGTDTKLNFICNKHGGFEQTPYQHINRKQGCPKCGIEKKSKKFSMGIEQFIERSNKVHNNKYDYSLCIAYKNQQSVMKIICPDHGVFEQLAQNHYTGHGCAKCMFQINSTKQQLTKEQFIEKARSIHSDKFEYVSEYSGYHKNVQIKCETHGIFDQLPGNHLKGQGCPKCSNNYSVAEKEISDFIESMGIIVDKRKRNIIPPHEIDIFLPEYNIAIEYCGLYYHSEISGNKTRSYHKHKMDNCLIKNIRLITIFSDEYIKSKDKVLNRLKVILGKSEKGSPARKTIVKRIEWKEASIFFEQFHLQGKGSITNINYGAFDGDVMVAAMSFSKGRIALANIKEDRFELIRYASDFKTHSGIASKLLAEFRKEFNPINMISYSDNRWSIGNLYEKLGFSLSHVSDPSYSYLKNYDVRFNRFKFRKDIIVNDMGGNPDKSEWENMQEFGYDRIWDCGTKVWVWSK